MTDGRTVLTVLSGALAAGVVAVSLAALAFALDVPDWLAVGGGIAAGVLAGSAVQRRIER
jgi:hypothetical protein